MVASTGACFEEEDPPKRASDAGGRAAPGYQEVALGPCVGHLGCRPAYTSATWPTAERSQRQDEGPSGHDDSDAFQGSLGFGVPRC